jgi:hypothetical protein
MALNVVRPGEAIVEANREKGVERSTIVVTLAATVIATAKA